MIDAKMYICSFCGHQSSSAFNRCPACQNWLEQGQLNVIDRQEEISAVQPSRPAQSASEEKIDDAPRLEVGIPEFDRVLGGGISMSSALLFTGAPGVGKSTLLMQVGAAIASKHGVVLYVSAEESLPQAAVRAKRIKSAHEKLFLLADNGLEETVAEMNRLHARVVIVDSLQLMRTRSSDTAPGTATQVKEVSANLTELAKKRGVPMLVAGQIIKTGKFAGPMSVPHLYDGVFHLDESTLPGFILLRVEKNRFGSKAEVGSFRMTAHGIEEVASPSAELLKGGGKGIIAVAMEGTKPIATEIQVGFLQRADLSEAVVGYPKDRLRLIQTILAGYEIDVPSGIALDVLGGYRITDPAADLAVAIATVFAAKNISTPTGWAAIGEVALDGRLIPPKHFAERFREIHLLGIEHVIIPQAGSDSFPSSRRTQIARAQTLREALRIAGALEDEKHTHPGRPKETREVRATPLAPAKPKIADMPVKSSARSGKNSAPLTKAERQKKRERLAEPRAFIPGTPRERAITVAAPGAIVLGSDKDVAHLPKTEQKVRVPTRARGRSIPSPAHKANITTPARGRTLSVTERKATLPPPATSIPSTPPAPPAIASPRHTPRILALIDKTHALSAKRGNLSTDLIRRELGVSIRIAHQLLDARNRT